ncbi:MAG: hypothetical protein SNJ71_06490, partial [Bacteroidales bacterium]
MLKIIENPTETKESKGVAFGLQGDLFIIPVAGLIISLIVFILFLFSGQYDPIQSLLISLLPFASATIFTYAFLNNKPPHDLIDKIEAMLDNHTFKVETFSPPTKASPFP